MTRRVQRSIEVRRSGLPDRRVTNEETRFHAVCLEAGAQFRGVQRGFSKVETMVMFDDPRHLTQLGSPTMTLPVSKFSLEAVKAKLSENEEKWKNG